jgi:hypothetical protein
MQFQLLSRLTSKLINAVTASLSGDVKENASVTSEWLTAMDMLIKASPMALSNDLLHSPLMSTYTLLSDTIADSQLYDKTEQQSLSSGQDLAPVIGLLRSLSDYDEEKLNDIRVRLSILRQAGYIPSAKVYDQIVEVFETRLKKIKSQENLSEEQYKIELIKEKAKIKKDIMTKESKK